jgi:hypothetical protein
VSGRLADSPVPGLVATTVSAKTYFLRPREVVSRPLPDDRVTVAYKGGSG